MTETMPVGRAVPSDGAQTCVEKAHAAGQCDGALSQVFAILGKRWNGMILGSLIEAPGGFSELRRGLGGISDSVLSDRLSGLATAGIVTRLVDSGPPVAVTYALTAAGQALLPAMDELKSWAQDHLPLG